MKYNGASNKELLVARGNQRHRDRYNLCQKIKNRIEVLVENFIMNEILEKLQIYLMVDFITKLLLVAGKYAILVVYDRLSKIAYFIAITKEILAEGLVKLFRNNI